MPKFTVTSTLVVDAEDAQEAAIKAVGLARRKPPATYAVVAPDGYTFPVQLNDQKLKEAVDRIWM